MHDTTQLIKDLLAVSRPENVIRVTNAWAVRVTALELSTFLFIPEGDVDDSRGEPMWICTVPGELSLSSSCQSS